MITDNSKDESKINIEEPWEANLWCKELNCTKDELLAALKEVGNLEKDVRKYLNK